MNRRSFMQSALAAFAAFGVALSEDVLGAGGGTRAGVLARFMSYADRAGVVVVSVGGRDVLKMLVTPGMVVATDWLFMPIKVEGPIHVRFLGDAAASIAWTASIFDEAPGATRIRSLDELLQTREDGRANTRDVCGVIAPAATESACTRPAP